MRSRSGSSWRTDLGEWLKSVGRGGRPAYMHQEFGQLYEIEPYEAGGRPLYRLTISAGGATDRVRFVTRTGGTSSEPDPFLDADSARSAAVAHQDRIRASHSRAHVLSSAFQRVRVGAITKRRR